MGWGCHFGALAFQIIWCVTPCLRFLNIALHPFKKIQSISGEMLKELNELEEDCLNNNLEDERDFVEKFPLQNELCFQSSAFDFDDEFQRDFVDNSSLKLGGLKTNNETSKENLLPTIIDKQSTSRFLEEPITNLLRNKDKKLVSRTKLFMFCGILIVLSQSICILRTQSQFK